MLASERGRASAKWVKIRPGKDEYPRNTLNNAKDRTSGKQGLVFLASFRVFRECILKKMGLAHRGEHV